MKRNKNWIKEEPVKITEPVDDSEYGVPFIPIRCPKCNSKDVRCYVSRPPIRYHVCKTCEKKFKSVEV
ncbi:hypothetical protein M0R36_04200 [bacterium]|nr:hypothetical protein [bacterium]